MAVFTNRQVRAVVEVLNISYEKKYQPKLSLPATLILIKWLAGLSSSRVVKPYGVRLQKANAGQRDG